MNAQKLSFKLFLKDPAQIHGVKLVPIFQSWIQLHAIEDHMAIDVADYEHVPDGPGTVLITHQANFSLDSAEGKPGLLYQRKQALDGTFEERQAAIFRYTLQAAARLEENPGLHFRTDEFQFKIADRLLAPNTVETFQAVKPRLETALKQLLGPTTTFTLTHVTSAEKLFEIKIQVANPKPLSALLA